MAKKAGGERTVAAESCARKKRRPRRRRSRREYRIHTLRAKISDSNTASLKLFRKLVNCHETISIGSIVHETSKVATEFAEKEAPTSPEVEDHPLSTPMSPAAATREVTLEAPATELLLSSPLTIGSCVQMATSHAQSVAPMRSTLAACVWSLPNARCGIMERVLGSMTTPCSFREFDCSATNPFTEKLTHEESCLHAHIPYCPIPYCRLYANHGWSLHEHIETEHYLIPYGEVTAGSLSPVTVSDNEPVCLVLLDSTTVLTVFLLVVERTMPSGCAVSVVQLASSSASRSRRWRRRISSTRSRCVCEQASSLCPARRRALGG
ncbi:hypothetical protein ZWY2020_031545 [Hordeum vulgare]|nr:hypothetical protein ZWY2020_031545 [Hordeum vulgare]